MRKILISFALVSLLVTACGGSVDCSSADYNELTQTYLEEWDSTITLSYTRFPGNLAPIIRDLEKLMGDFQNLDLPACYQPTHDKNLAGMQLDLEGVKEFDQTGEVGDQQQQADAEFAAALVELQKLDQ